MRASIELTAALMERAAQDPVIVGMAEDAGCLPQWLVEAVAVALSKASTLPDKFHYGAPGMPDGASERAREAAERLPTVGQWPETPGDGA